MLKVTTNLDLIKTALIKKVLIEKASIKMVVIEED